LARRSSSSFTLALTKNNPQTARKITRKCAQFFPQNSTLVDGNILVVQIEGNFRKIVWEKPKNYPLYNIFRKKNILFGSWWEYFGVVFWWSQKYTLSWCNFWRCFKMNPRFLIFLLFWNDFIVIEVLFYGYFRNCFILILKLLSLRILFQSGEQRVWDWDVSVATCTHSRPVDKSPDPSVWMCDHMFVVL
jgi:hypothetical protein